MIDTINRGMRRIPTWTVYLVGAIWAAWLFWLGLTGQLGAEPINKLEREYGETALNLLVAGLAITPLRRWPGLNLIRFRRAVGLTAFGFVVAHFTIWALLDVGTWGRVVADILKRPYVTVGMLALIGMIPLALTSNNRSVRAMGSNWRKLHRLTYAVCLLGALHYIWLTKGFPWEPLIYTVIIVGLLAVRLPMFNYRASRTRSV